METIGQIIKRKRQERKLIQKKLASKIGVAQSTVVNWERGLAFPSIMNCMALADLFNCSLDELCGREVKINE